jgi:hypothetical protein
MKQRLNSKVPALRVDMVWLLRRGRAGRVGAGWGAVRRGLVWLLRRGTVGFGQAGSGKVSRGEARFGCGGCGKPHKI